MNKKCYIICFFQYLNRYQGYQRMHIYMELASNLFIVFFYDITGIMRSIILDCCSSNDCFQLIEKLFTIYGITDEGVQNIA